MEKDSAAARACSCRAAAARIPTTFSPRLQLTPALPRRVGTQRRAKALRARPHLSNRVRHSWRRTPSYPSGTAGVDGSMAHGAPANAGGGATDGHPNGANPGGNDQNAGGGGGANGGTGGYGGNSWNSNLSSGGEGGAVFPATIDRIAMGGGGGAGIETTRTEMPRPAAGQPAAASSLFALSVSQALQL